MYKKKLFLSPLTPFPQPPEENYPSLTVIQGYISCLYNFSLKCTIIIVLEVHCGRTFVVVGKRFEKLHFFLNIKILGRLNTTKDELCAR